MKRLMAAAFMSLVMSCCVAEDADAAFARAVAVLQQSQADHTQLVQAIKLLSDVAALYEKNGDDQKGASVNACLYWARKRMTLADTESLKNAAEVGKRLEAVSKPVPTADAKAMLAKVDAFSQEHGHNQLLVAIRYFEIADRFPETEDGRKAMQLSLAAMQKVGEKGKLAEYKPAATDGKAFIQSEPAGASIILVNGDVRQDTTKKTPALLQIPIGVQALELELKSFRTARLSVSISESAIAKPNVVKLQPPTAFIDVVFEPGWRVFIDEKDTFQTTPATVEASLGTHQVGLAKEGFRDVFERVALKNLEKITLESKAKPQPGPSALLAAAAAKLKEEMKETAGKWDGKHYAWNSVVDLKSDGTFLMKANNIGGKWTLEGATLVLNWSGYAPERLQRVDKNTFSANRFTLTRK